MVASIAAAAVKAGRAALCRLATCTSRDSLQTVLSPLSIVLHGRHIPLDYYQVPVHPTYHTRQPGLTVTISMVQDLHRAVQHLVLTDPSTLPYVLTELGTAADGASGSGGGDGRRYVASAGSGGGGDAVHGVSCVTIACWGRAQSTEWLAQHDRPAPL